MSKIMDRDVFDYCEKRFNELNTKDGGYHPLKHDSLVFNDASQTFNISIEEVDKIYDKFNKLAAKIELAKINRLPKNKRNAAQINRIRDIFLNNHDLPFHQIEGEPSEPIKPNNQIIQEEYESMINNIAIHGWTIPLYFELDTLEELSRCSESHSALDSYFETFYIDYIFTKMTGYIADHITNPGQQARFMECISTYNQGLFSSCTTVLTTILEGLISLFGDDAKDVRVMRICNYQASENSKVGNNLKALYWKSVYSFTTILFEKNDFSSKEPSELNRHWLIHGRTGQISSKLDCLRLFNAISTIISLLENQK